MKNLVTGQPRQNGSKGKNVNLSSKEVPVGNNLTSSQINFSDHNEIREQLDLLSHTQRNTFQSAFSRIKQQNGRYADSYFDNAAFMVSAQPVYAIKFSRCGIPNDLNKSGRCSKRQFCPRCAGVKFWHHWKALELAYHGNQFSFATFSFNGDIRFNTAGQDRCKRHWDAIQHGLKWLLKNKHINGALISEELSIRSFLPTRVLPHAHAILEGADMNDAVLDDLKEEIGQYTENGVGPELIPSIQVKPIISFDAYKDEMAYLFKPINIKTAYTSAWLKVEPNDRTEAWKLNSELSDFFSGHVETTRNEVMIRRIGNMHGHSKHFIGTKKKKAKNKPRRVFSFKPATAIIDGPILVNDISDSKNAIAPQFCPNTVVSNPSKENLSEGQFCE